MELLHKDLTEKIIKSFFNVYNELGFGFLEKVYEIEVGLLLSFGKNPKFVKKVFENKNK